jgi:hypothetical protein
VIANATALGGAAGHGDGTSTGILAGSATAFSSAIATGKGAKGTATANASATGGADPNNNFSSFQGSGDAEAVAITAKGQLATATATAAGGSGSATSFAITNAGPKNAVTTYATGDVSGAATKVQSQANAGGPPAGLDTTGLNAYAFGALLPSAATVSAALATQPTFTPIFGAPGAVLGMGTQGAAYASGASGLQHYRSQVTFDINLAQHPVPGDIFIGFLADTVSGSFSGSDSIEFSEAATRTGSTLDITFSLDLLASSADEAVGFNYLFGDPFGDPIFVGPDFSTTFFDATDAQNFFAGGVYDFGPLPADSTAAPEPSTLSLFGFGAISVFWLRHRAVAKRTASR